MAKPKQKRQWHFKQYFHPEKSIPVKKQPDNAIAIPDFLPYPERDFQSLYQDFFGNYDPEPIDRVPHVLLAEPSLSKSALWALKAENTALIVHDALVFIVPQPNDPPIDLRLSLSDMVRELIERQDYLLPPQSFDSNEP